MDSNHAALIVKHSNYISNKKASLMEVASNQPPGFVESMIRMALVELSKNEKLAVCTPDSLFIALNKAAELGLSAGGMLARAYLIPRYNKKKGVSEVELQIGYEGLIDIIKRSGEADMVVTRVVFENDKFSHKFSSKEGELLEHEPTHKGARGEPVGVYAVAFLANGKAQVEYVTAEEIGDIKKMALDEGRSGPWKEFPYQMWRKSAVKRLTKYLRLDPVTHSALEYDTKKEIGIEEDVELPPDVKATILGEANPPEVIDTDSTVQPSLAEVLTLGSVK